MGLDWRNTDQLREPVSKFLCCTPEASSHVLAAVGGDLKQISNCRSALLSRAGTSSPGNRVVGLTYTFEYSGMAPIATSDQIDVVNAFGKHVVFSADAVDGTIFIASC